MAGLLKKKKSRDMGEIPTASMADIAFLLLIFFLVTTTIDVDTGIGMTLPPKLEEDQEPPPVKERNMLKILVNANAQVLLEDQPSAISRIRGEVKKHTLNEGQDPNYAETMSRAIVSLKTDRQTPYDTYIQVLDEIWMAYFEMWDAEARRMGYSGYVAYRTYLDENNIEENEIREKIKAQISIAEPDPDS
jgi:biopolymer transport protein ExbD